MTEVEKAKKVAELAKKIESAKREVKQYSEFLDSDIRFSRDTTRNASNLKYAVERQKTLQKELDRLT